MGDRQEVLYVGGSDLVRSPNHRAHHFIRFLEKHASRVDVVALKPFYSGPHPASRVSKVRAGLRGYVDEPVEVLEKETGTQFKVRKLPNRMDPYMQDVWAYFHLATLLRRRYDLGFFGNPDNALLAWFLKRRGVVETLVYDDWDLFAAFDRPAHWRRSMAWRERLAVTTADVVLSVGSLLAELRQEQGARQTHVVPNGVNYRVFARAQQKKAHPPTLVYTGSLEEWSGLDLSIEGFARVRAQLPDARFLIIGPNDNAYARSLRALAEGLGLGQSVCFLGFQPYEELHKFLAEGDVGVALFLPNEQMKYAFHLKIVEYMAAGMAVIGTRIGETERIINQSDAGRAIDANAEAFAAAALSMLTNRSELAEYVENGQEYARQYDWDVVFSSLHDLIGLQQEQKRG